MKVIGLLGGMGPESTVNYYSHIIKLYRERTGKDEYPSIVINSVCMTRMLGMVSRGELDELVDFLAAGVEKLIAAGAEICAICSNTPHLVFEALEKRVSLPLVSIVDAAATEAQRREAKRVLLIGTSFTMKNDFYSKSFGARGISLFVPEPQEQEIIHNTIFPELEEGIVIPEKKAVLLNICRKIMTENKLDGVILGCTELPLMIKPGDFDREIYDTVEIHIDALLKEAMGGTQANEN
ncbi:MAG: amino acid racemase [Spirochaetales bacterium]|nr:amino acid racemase [Spirochaetales bacterium]